MEKTWNSSEPPQEWPADQITPRTHQWLISEVTEEPGATATALQVSLTSVKFHDPTIAKRLSKVASLRKLESENLL